MLVNDVAKSFGVTADTVRFYIRKGLVNPVQNQENGYHNFSKADMDRLKFIITAKRLGFTLADIGKILSISDKGDEPCSTVIQLIETRLEEIEKKYLEISRLRKKMRTAVESWKLAPDPGPNETCICHLIESFAEI